jgi:hypothetical protein
LAFRTRRRPSDFAPSSETPGGYVGQAVLESGCQRERLAKLREGVFPGSRPAAAGLKVPASGATLSRFSMPAGKGSAFGPIPAKVHRTPSAFTGTRLIDEQPLASGVGTEFDSTWIGPGKQINGVPSNSGKHRR